MIDLLAEIAAVIASTLAIAVSLHDLRPKKNTGAGDTKKKPNAAPMYSPQMVLRSL